MFSRFFIDRPIFAAVLSLVITLAGGLALCALPVAEYPPIAPPTVQVSCQYPGANAQVVAETVAAPIEQQVNGVEDMLYMSSQSSNDGRYSLTVTFKTGVDLNVAQVLVQNRVNLALPLLPEVLRKSGITTRKRSPNILLFVSYVSPDGRYDQLYLSNYALTRVRDELARLPGVSEAFLFGQRDYSLRVWVDPDRLAARGLTAGDVAAALREQNVAVALGQAGQAPAPAGLERQVPLTTLGRLSDPEQFGNIVLKTGSEGGILRLRDVARIELAARNTEVNAYVNDLPSVSIGIFQLPDANAFETATIVRAKLAELARDYPEGLTHVIRWDTTPFIWESIKEVFKTLLDAVLLVAVVVLLFLQNWRSALIPLLAVPVAIIGTFAVMLACGFSINNLTLFGLVLAIGIVVDDAIVVVEAVERQLERGLAPRAAALAAMEQVSGPVIAIGLVLSAVFIPCAFIGGITGQFFRQFALTIAASTLISALNSLTLSPALAVLLLRPREKETHQALPRLAFALLGGWLGWGWLAHGLVDGAAQLGEGWWNAPAVAQGAAWVAAAVGLVAGWLLARPANRLLTWAFHGFNRGFEWVAGRYVLGVGRVLRLSALAVLAYLGLLGLTWVGFRGVPEPLLPESARGVKLGSLDLAHGLPRGFLPPQDKGFLLVFVELPDAAADERTQVVMRRAQQIVAATRGIKDATVVSGTSWMLDANSSNLGSMFLSLQPFEQRTTPELRSNAIADRLRRKFTALIPEATVLVVDPPPLWGVGAVGGFQLMLKDQGDLGLQALQEATEVLAREAGRQPGLTGVNGFLRSNVPQLLADVDRQQCLSLGVPLGGAFDALQIYLGSLYVNDFNRFGRTWQVIVQAEDRFRIRTEDMRRLHLRNADGQIVPLGAVARMREIQGPLLVTRYNMHTAATIYGSAAPGVSTGEALARMQQVADRHLPAGMASDWTGMAFLEQYVGNMAPLIFLLSVVMVFLVLAALYESWSLPLAIILIVPLCLLSASAGLASAGLDINIFAQIGFVVLVGLASKNAILIVEFAKMQREAGVARREAVLEACRLRLRPIVMTSLAFILGVLPLVLARGAGAEMRQALGVPVFSGMLGVTFFGLFLTPVFFYVIDGLGCTRLFAAPRTRRVGHLALAILTGGASRILALVRRGKG